MNRDYTAIDGSDITALYDVADAITTGRELCDSRWQKTEAELIACQAIGLCALNHRKHGDAFSWQGLTTKAIGGNGLFDNPAGIGLLIDDGCIVLEPYKGPLTAPQTTVRDADGRPVVIRVTRRLLDYAAEHIAANAEPAV